MAINNEGLEYKGLEMEGYQEEKSNEKCSERKKGAWIWNWEEHGFSKS